MKKLGILTYYWPPAGGPGVQRWLKLSKYMAETGIEIHVVCPDPSVATYPLKDQSLLSDIHPNIHVHTTATNEKFGLYKKLTRKKEVPFSGFSGEDAQVSMLQKAARFFRGNFMVPDARKGWNKHAYQTAARIIKEKDVRHWITTSPPHSTQLVGLQLKANFGIHWTADFRDPWTDIYYYRKFYPTALTRAYEARLERKVFSTCDTLISVSPAWSELYRSKGAQPAAKVHTITNGFDPKDFSGLPTARPSRLTLTYAGTLAAQYPVAPLVSALKKLAHPVHLRIIGSWDQASAALLQTLSDPVEVSFIPYMPKKELNAELKNSHLMLFLLPNVESASGHIPGKLFDYLGSCNPIFGLGPTHGDAARIIHEAGAGQVFSYDDVDGMLEFLQEIAQNGIAPLSMEQVKPFSREVQAAQVVRAIFPES